jgi:hypothetical protein
VDPRCACYRAPKEVKGHADGDVVTFTTDNMEHWKGGNLGSRTHKTMSYERFQQRAFGMVGGDEINRLVRAHGEGDGAEL